jgi:hypothetical protein
VLLFCRRQIQRHIFTKTIKQCEKVQVQKSVNNRREAGMRKVKGERQFGTNMLLVPSTKWSGKMQYVT